MPFDVRANGSVRIGLQKLIVISAALFAVAGAQAAPAAASRVVYRLSPVLAGDQLEALDVEIRMEGDSDGLTVFDLPTRWAGHKQLWKNLKDFQVEGGRQVAGGDPSQISIEAAPRSQIKLHYQIVSPVRGAPSVDDELPYVPWVRPDWFYLSGESVFATPEERDGAQVSFAWSSAPGWSFASDLENLSALPDGGTLRDIRKSTLIGGLRLKILQSGSTRVAIVGEHGFSEQDFVSKLDKVLTTERAFWGDPPRTPYLVTIGPLAASPGVASLSGNSKGDAFAMAATPDTPIEEIAWFLSHETFHTWIPGQLGGSVPGRPPAEAALDAWFSEGMTDFYARRIAARSGAFSLDDFVRSWNEVLLDYAISPVRTVPNNALIARAGEPEIEKLPYQRGALLAALWNSRLIGASHGKYSLDDVLLLQRSMAEKAPSAGAPALFRLSAKRLGLDVESDLAAIVEAGAGVSLPANAFGSCLRVITVSQPRFDRGFDAEATAAAGMIVVGVRPGSPAARAGLADGMTLRRQISGRSGDATIDYAWEVSAKDGSLKTIRYKPAGLGTVTLQRLERVKNSKSAASCLAALGGSSSGSVH
jgi:predicted metalloprotease with PDZ domain